jgi:hypothetical protein
MKRSILLIALLFTFVLGLWAGYSQGHRSTAQTVAAVTRERDAWKTAYETLDIGVSLIAKINKAAGNRDWDGFDKAYAAYDQWKATEGASK